MSPTLSCSKSFHRKNPANPTATIAAVLSFRQFSSTSRFRMIFAVSCFFSGSFLLGWWASLLFAAVTTCSVMSPVGGGTHAFLCAHTIAATAFTTGLAESALPRRSTRYNVTAISVAGRALNSFSLAHVLHWLNAVLYPFTVDSACVSIAMFFALSLSRTSPLASAASCSSFHFFCWKISEAEQPHWSICIISPRQLDPPPPASHCMSLQAYAFDFPSDLRPPFTILRGRSGELLNITLLCYSPFLLN